MGTHNKQSLRPLTIEDVYSVTRVHIAAFPDSALTLLGSEAVSRYYEWQFIGPHDLVAFGVFEDNHLIGIVFAGIFRGALGGYVRKNAIFLISRFILRPWLIFHPELRGDIAAGVRILFGYKRRRKKTSTNDQIIASSSTSFRYFGSLSLAVHPDHRGLAAILLVKEVERVAFERGFDGVNLTTHPGNEKAEKLYTMLGYHKVLHDGIWSGGLRKEFMRQEISSERRIDENAKHP